MGGTTSSSGGAGGETSSSSGSTGSGGATSGTGGSGGAGGSVVGGDLVWSKAFPGCSDATGVVSDPAGRITIGGAACGPTAIDFGEGLSLNWWALEHRQRSYVAGFDGTGKALWLNPISFESEQGASARVDDVNAAGRIAAYTHAIVQGGTVNDHLRVYLADGALVWDKFLLNSGANIQSFSIDTADRALGRFSCAAACTFGSNGTYLVKYDAAGVFLWKKKIGDINLSSYYRTVVAPTGEIIGATSAGFDFGCGPADAHVAKLDDTGNCLWARHFLGTVPTLRVATNVAGEVLIVALFTGLVDFGCGPLSNAAGKSLAITKLDASGTCLFSKTFTGPGLTLPPNATTYPAVRSTGAGQWIVVLPFLGAIDLGGGPISPADPQKAEILLIKLDASGNPAWNRRLLTPYNGIAGINDAPSFSGDAAGGMILLANDPMLDLGNGPVLGGSPGLILAKFAP